MSQSERQQWRERIARVLAELKDDAVASDLHPALDDNPPRSAAWRAAGDDVSTTTR